MADGCWCLGVEGGDWVFCHVKRGAESWWERVAVVAEDGDRLARGPADEAVWTKFDGSLRNSLSLQSSITTAVVAAVETRTSSVFFLEDFLTAVPGDSFALTGVGWTVFNAEKEVLRVTMV